MIRLGASHPEWAFGYEYETWWIRLARPAFCAWAEEDKPLHLEEQSVAKNDPDPKALAAYGFLVRLLQPDGSAKEEVWLRFVDGRPVSSVSIQCLEWLCERVKSLGKRALLLDWRNAPWHINKEVRTWLRDHNRRVKREGRGVRIIVCYLPIKSPWLSPIFGPQSGPGMVAPYVLVEATIEPRWIRAKRKVVEPDPLLNAQELVDRVCAHFHCQHDAHLVITEKAV